MSTLVSRTNLPSAFLMYTYIYIYTNEYSIQVDEAEEIRYQYDSLLLVRSAQGYICTVANYISGPQKTSTLLKLPDALVHCSDRLVGCMTLPCP